MNLLTYLFTRTSTYCTYEIDIFLSFVYELSCLLILLTHFVFLINYFWPKFISKIK